MQLNRRVLTALLISLASSALLQGCAISRTLGWNQSGETASLSPAEKAKLSSEARAHWAKRLDRTELEKALASWEKIARATPSDFESHAMLARGYYLLADSHLPDSQMEEKKKFWEVGTSWGEKALATNAAFKKKVQDEQSLIEDSLDTLTKNEVPAIYWTAVNLGKWAKNSNITTTLKYKTRIKRMIEKVEQLDPDYFYGATNRYWGVYYSALPKLFGGSLEKSDEQFQKSFNTAKNYFGTYTLYADNFSRKKGDREGFRKALNFVLQTKPGVIAEIEPEQTLEQRRAKTMLDNEKGLFE